MISSEWLGAADKALATAEFAYGIGDLRSANSRAYYAAFYAARVALSAIGEHERSLGKTHSGLRAAFAELLVKPGHLPKELSRLFAILSDQRLAADYQGDFGEEGDARMSLDQARAFVAAVRAWVETRHSVAQV